MAKQVKKAAKSKSKTNKTAKAVSTAPDTIDKTEKPDVAMVAIGASAGGLEPFEQFFDAMPVTSGIAFVVIQHLSPDFESMMDELLSRHSTMDIKRVVDDLPVKPNTIYLNPPRSKMVVRDGRFNLTANPDTRQLNLPIDIFFESLAHEYGEHAIAVVLSGTGSDGTRGAAVIKEHKGKVLVQAPDSAKFDGMPRSVIESGNFDAIAEPHKLPLLIKRIGEGKSIEPSPEGVLGDDPAKYVFFKLREKFGTDFGYYKDATIRRRLDRRAQLANMDLEQYAKRLDRDADEVDALYADLLIDVTSFFRDPQGFKAIHEHAIEPLGKLMTHDKQVRVWIPGCSSGEEAYSFAIAFADYARENNRPINLKIMATDIHKRSLGAAAEGIYPKASLKGLKPEQIERYFDKHVDYYQVKQSLRRLVVFSQHNLLRDPPFTRIDLVSCRNVLIYFEEQAQQKTLALFHFALNVKGTLFLGPSESLGKLEDEFDTLDRRWKIYRKRRSVRLLEATSLLPRDSQHQSKGHHKAPFLPGRTGTIQRFQKAHGDALELMLKRFAPPGFLLNRSGEVIHVFGSAGKFTQIDGGVFSNRIIDLIDPQLRLAVTAGLERLTTAEKLEFERRVIMSNDDGETNSVIVSLVSLASVGASAGHFLLTLVTSDSTQKSLGPLPKFLDTSETSNILQRRILDLERDLTSTEESLQSLVEELQTSNEELQASNEELMASNEELQSTNEELHSVNEELYTVSAEHQIKIDQLTLLTDDMNLLLKATSIGIIFLDDMNNIRRFTPSSTAVFNLLDQDIGRPFEHTTYRFESVDLMEEIAKVKRTSTEFNNEISVEGKDYILRVVPYLTSVKQASGVVITLVDVSQFKAAERARLAEQEVFKTAINDITDELTRVDLDTGLVVLANESVATSYNRSVDDIVGKKLADLVGGEKARLAFESIKSQASDEIHQQEVVENEGTDSERIMLRKTRLISNDNGEVVAMQIAGQDITEEHRYREVLESLLSLGENRLDDVAETMMSILKIGCKYLGLPSGIISRIQDEEYVVDYCWGFDDEALKAGDVLNYRNTVCYHLEKTFDPIAIDHLGATDLSQEPCYKQTGIESYVGVRTSTPEGFYGALSFSNTEKRKRPFNDLELAIVHLLGQSVGSLVTHHSQLSLLEKRKQELEDLNEGLNRFTYLASHDLQEPLRKIQQSGELLQADFGEKLDEDGAYFLDIMTGSAGRMRSLIDDLLLYSSSANQSLVRKPIAVKSLVEAAVGELSEKIEETKAKVKINKLPTATCDPGVMKQVYLNIISNSLKYRNPDVAPKITISSKTYKNYTRLSFKDNGIGMELEDGVNILDPFVRLHSKHEYSGSGIGLAICKSVCDRHGWKIEIESELGEGTEIAILIPADHVS